MEEDLEQVDLDLNNPADARIFIKDAMPLVFEGKEITHFDLQDGSRILVSDINDSQAIQYAWELLPLFQAKFPENVNVSYEDTPKSHGAIFQH